LSEVTDWTNPTPGTLYGIWAPELNAILDKIRSGLQALEIAFGKDPANDEATATAAALLGAAAMRQLFVVANAAEVALTVKGNADAGGFGVIALQRWLDFAGNEIAALFNAGGFYINDWLSVYRSVGNPPNWRANIYGWVDVNGRSAFVWPGPPGNLLPHVDAAQCVFDGSRAGSTGSWNIPFGAGSLALQTESAGVPNTTLPTGFHSIRLTADSSGSLVATTASGTSGIPATAGSTYSAVAYTYPEGTARNFQVGIQFFNGASFISQTLGSSTPQSGWTKGVSGGIVAPATTTRMCVVAVIAGTANGEHHRLGSAALYPGTQTEYSPPAVAQPWPTFGQINAGAVWEHQSTGNRWLCTTGGVPSAQVWEKLATRISTATPQALGSAAAGTSGNVADGAHVHPTTGLVTTSRQVLAGDGMTGGGALSADVTLTRLGRVCRIRASSAGQTITSGSLDRIVLNTLDFNDSTSYFTTDVVTTRSITVVKAGLYGVNYELKFSGGSSGQRYASIYVNGAIVRESGTGSATATSISGSTTMRLSASDVVDLRGFVDGGSTVTVVSSQPYETGLTLTHLGS
jgi:hypothetical protein